MYLASRDSRVPRPAKLLAGAVVAYALSPIDLIPDFIPILGYLDDLIVIPLGFLLATRMIPSPILADLRQEASIRIESGFGKWLVAAAIAALWLALTAAVLAFFLM